jgi:hypothetical protein
MHAKDEVTIDDFWNKMLEKSEETKANMNDEPLKVLIGN